MVISLSAVLRMTNVSDRILEKIKVNIFILFFSEIFFVTK